MCYPAEFGRFGQTVWALLRRALLRRSARKIWPLSISLKMIEPTRIDPSPIDFLLTFYSNYGPILYRFRDKRRFQSKIANLPHPVVFNAPAEGVPLGVGYRRSGLKTRMMELPGRERNLRYLQPSGYNTRTWRTDRWMDRQTPADTTATTAIRKHRAVKTELCRTQNTSFAKRTYLCFVMQQSHNTIRFHIFIFTQLLLAAAVLFRR